MKWIFDETWFDVMIGPRSTASGWPLGVSVQSSVSLQSSSVGGGLQAISGVSSIGLIQRISGQSSGVCQVLQCSLVGLLWGSGWSLEGLWSPGSLRTVSRGSLVVFGGFRAVFRRSLGSLYCVSVFTPACCQFVPWVSSWLLNLLWTVFGWSPGSLRAVSGKVIKALSHRPRS